jgi:hypothetical protein
MQSPGENRPDLSRAAWNHDLHQCFNISEFEIFIDPQTDEVVYRIRAVSRPQATLARVGQPIVRVLHTRFRKQSAAAMKHATTATATSRL